MTGRKVYLLTGKELEALKCCGHSMRAVPKAWAASCLQCGTLCLWKLEARE